MQADEKIIRDVSTDRSAQTDLGISILSGLAARIDRPTYEAVRAQGRRPDESALDFEFRCIYEATP